MHKSAVQQRVSRLVGEKQASEFSTRKGENSLESIRSKPGSKPSERQKPENVLEFARKLCDLANEGETVALSPSAIDTLSFLSKVNHRAKWQPDRPCIAFVQVEKAILTKRLADVITGCNSGKHFPLEDRRSGLGRITSQGRLEWQLIAPLGPNQDIFERAMRHSKTDVRRFARCTVCRRFFYKPRETSRTCQRKCENVLVSRDHYKREKQHRACALELHGQGKELLQIARELGLKPAKVRQYLAGGKEKP